MPDLRPFKEGDPIWYRHPIAGIERDVPGVFVKATRKRIKVRVWTRGRHTVIAVSPKNVRPRDPMKGH